MATGGRFSGSLSTAHEEFFDFICTPCSKDDSIIEALHQCLECDEYFCEKCIAFHNKFGATSGHKVLEKKDMRTVLGSKPKVSLPTQRCPDHHGERITTYCADHDAICCTTCVDISHKTCGGITYIVDVAQGIKSGSQLKSAKGTITTTLKDLKKKKSSRKKYMTVLDNDRTAHVQQVKDMTERLIKRIRELEKLTINQIDSKYKEQSDMAGEDITHLDGAISVMEADLKNLDQSQQNSESTVFVDTKLGQRHAAEGRKIIQQIGAHHKASTKLVMKTTVEHSLNDLTTLGNLVDDSKVYKAKLEGEYSIKLQQDTLTCDILGPCLLPDGTVIVTDYKNKRLKRMDPSYRVTDHCDMPYGPFGVTCTAPDEVAVTLTHLKKVQFVSVRDSMSMTRSFSTSDKCRGICYSAGELFVSCGGQTRKGLEEGPGHVSVYSLNGTLLRTIQTDPSGKQIFSLPYHITASPDGARIYVAQRIGADDKGGVVSSDRSGKSVCSFTDPSLEYAVGVCTLDNGHLLVCGYVSHNVLQFDGDGRKVATLLEANDGIKYPRSLTYDNNHSRLMVTMQGTDTIKVFNIM